MEFNQIGGAMNPRDYYRMKTATITEADVRLVAAVMTDYIGEANAVRIETLAGRVDMHERQVRDILAILVKQYGWPICANAGKAGRWIATSEDDRWQVIGDLDSRIKELRERREAMLTAKIPNALELNRQEARVMQTGLF
jgi:hypothetical protein